MCSKQKCTEQPAALDLALGFGEMVDAIRQVHEYCASQAKRAVNTNLTLRNWLIGGYIHHYELYGRDRATYGEGLIDTLAGKLMELQVPNCDRRQLYRYLRFFRLYPEIAGTLSPQFDMLPAVPTDGGAETRDEMVAQNVGTGTPQLALPPEKLIGKLSYSHIELITALDTPLKRVFYEIECIRGNWSVRTLKRQIATLYFERSGLSEDKEKLAEMIKDQASCAAPELEIRDPYVFEFLGLRAKDAVTESNLEAGLIENLREFLLEMGHGFCLEAQQKSIVIGNTRGFVDLVFYHRLLKCHVLVELKVDEFHHEYIGQLNTYVTWYRENMMAEGDNPPVGLLLCTQKDHALVEYALAAIDNRLFVSKYQLELPSQEELVRFLDAKRRELGGGN
ncbi:MAG: PDDEXK nuclease domain-containing protein [Lentisphaeria bacterium]|nr:PDDEXK nuclease domain-containing protein [Lentisphaeria bacterium]